MKDFKIIRKIASGGMGDVFEAVIRDDSGTEMRVAAKAIRADAKPSDLAAFKAECEILKKLRHPSITEFLSVIENDGQTYLLTSFEEGQSLAQIFDKIQSKGLAIPQESLIALAKQIVQAVSFLHQEAGDKPAILHRDLSPHNIIVNYDGAVKLIDFGISKVLVENQDFTKTEEFKGKLTYAAPESISRNEFSKASDIYAIGVMLFELACGKRVFQGNDSVDSIALVLHFNAPALAKLRPDLKPKLAELIELLLAKDAKRRPTSLEILAKLDAVDQIPNKLSIAKYLRDLEKYSLQGVSTQTGNFDMGSYRSVSQVSRRLFVRAVAGLLLLAVLGVFGYSYLHVFTATFIEPGKSPQSVRLWRHLTPELGEGSPSLVSQLACEAECSEIADEVSNFWNFNFLKNTSQNLKISGAEEFRNLAIKQLKGETVKINALLASCDSTPVCKHIGLAREKSIEALANLQIPAGTPIEELPNLLVKFYVPDFDKIERDNFLHVFDPNRSNFKKDIQNIEQLKTSPIGGFDIYVLPWLNFPNSRQSCEEFAEVIWMRKVLREESDGNSTIAVSRFMIIPSGSVTIENMQRQSVNLKTMPGFKNIPFCYFERDGWKSVYLEFHQESR